PPGATPESLRASLRSCPRLAVVTLCLPARHRTHCGTRSARVLASHSSRRPSRRDSGLTPGLAALVSSPRRRHAVPPGETPDSLRHSLRSCPRVALVTPSLPARLRTHSWPRCARVLASPSSRCASRRDTGLTAALAPLVSSRRTRHAVPPGATPDSLLASLRSCPRLAVVTLCL